MIENTPSLFDYDYTWKLSRSRWAWEFLKRNGEFLKAASRHGPDELSSKPACSGITLIQPICDQAEANRWGLAFFPDVLENGFDANVFWCGSLYPRHLNVQVSMRANGEVCDIYDKVTKIARIFHLTDTLGREHLLLKGNGCVIQVSCSGLSLLSAAPVKMSHLIKGGDALDEKYKKITRAQEVYGADYVEGPKEWSRNSLCLRNALVAVDCQRLGLSYRETAAVIYGRQRAEEAWNSPSRAMKDEMRRALTKGRDLVEGGYRNLLMAEKSYAKAA